jgi:di/tricarboxylate transporter
MSEQLVFFGVLLAALVCFVVGRPRYDLVAMAALLVLTVLGIVPAAKAFSGFSHPAVVTVAAVLVLSRTLERAGVVSRIAGWVGKVRGGFGLQRAVLVGLVATLSAFMNNVGALALLMPVAVQLARKAEAAPSRILMPLAAGSLLGGLVTLIGTPPNIIVATFRADAVGRAFGVFDFTPVGLVVAAAGVALLALVGERLLPDRGKASSREETFALKEYTSEVRVPDGSRWVGRPIKELFQARNVDAVVVGLVRGEERELLVRIAQSLRAGDVLIVEASSEDLARLVDATGFELVGGTELGEEHLRAGDVEVAEAIVMPDSLLRHRTVREVDLRRRFGLNLLAVARSGTRLRGRLGSTRFRPGDVLLLQGRAPTLPHTMAELGTVHVGGGALALGTAPRPVLPTAIFAAAIAAAALGLIPVEVSFSVAAVVMVLLRLLPLREAYESIEWPVIFLLAAILPLAGAFETTGGAALVSSALVAWSAALPPAVSVGLVLTTSMLLANLVNKAAAVLMAPVAISVAAGLGASPDPFLMAVAVGASTPFLTPIGHQSNTLVMGPGGYRFSDYWRLGLPLSILVVVVAVPLILGVWPP